MSEKKERQKRLFRRMIQEGDSMSNTFYCDLREQDVLFRDCSNIRALVKNGRKIPTCYQCVETEAWRQFQNRPGVAPWTPSSPPKKSEKDLKLVEQVHERTTEPVEMVSIEPEQLITTTTPSERYVSVDLPDASLGAAKLAIERAFQDAERFREIRTLLQELKQILREIAALETDYTVGPDENLQRAKEMAEDRDRLKRLAVELRKG